MGRAGLRSVRCRRGVVLLTILWYVDLVPADDEMMGRGRTEVDKL